MSKISGPLLDRIDIHIEVPAVAFRELSGGTPGTSSAEMRKQVMGTRQTQTARFDGSRTRHNGQMVAERRIPLENPYRTSKEECKYRGTVCETLACTVARSRDIEVEANIVARDSSASLDGKTARAGGGIVRMVTMPIRLVAAPFH